MIEGLHDFGLNDQGVFGSDRLYVSNVREAELLIRSSCGYTRALRYVDGVGRQSLLDILETVLVDCRQSLQKLLLSITILECPFTET